MHHPSIRGPLLGLLAVLFMFSTPFPAAALQERATGTIRGVVTLASQDPLPGALVLLTDVGTSVRTDDSGNYEIRLELKTTE